MFTATIQLSKEESDLVTKAQTPPESMIFCLRPGFVFSKSVQFLDGIEGVITISSPLSPEKSNKPSIQFSLWKDGDECKFDDNRDSYFGNHKLIMDGEEYSVTVLAAEGTKKPIAYYEIPEKRGDTKYMVTLPGEYRDVIAAVYSTEPITAVEEASRYLSESGVDFFCCDYYELADVWPVTDEHYDLDNLYLPVEGTTVAAITDLTRILQQVARRANMPQ